MKKKAIYLIIIFIALILITIGFSFAYFTAKYDANDVIHTKSGEIKITYTNDGIITGSLSPASDYLDGITTSSTIKLEDSSISTKANIKLDITALPSVLASSALKWTLVKDNEIVANGDFSTAQENDTITLLENFSLSETTSTLNLYIWLNGEDTTNNMMNQSFSAKLYVTANIVTGSENQE